MPRLLDRQGPFRQSMGRMNIRRLGSSSTCMLRWSDVFHTVVDSSTYKVILAVTSLIIISWLLFALLFLMVSKQCGLGADSYLRSLYLAIETMETIGYGVPDTYFNSCYTGVFVLGAASLWESVLNAVLISVVYTRISRSNARASSVCFSDKAVISQIDGNHYFMFQLCDFRKHQLCSASVRLYCTQHTATPTGAIFQTRAMRLQHPDDTLGAMLLPALPQVVTHRIDAWSPMWPRGRPGSSDESGSSFRFPDVFQREADMQSSGGGVEPGLDAAEIARHIALCQYEVVCLMEGADPLTGGTVQSRHSYTCDDIVFNAAFRRCVARADDGACEIDFGAFHELTEKPPIGEVFVQSMP